MRRLTVQLLGSALCVLALGGCSMMGDSAPATTAAAAPAPAADAPSPMAPDVESALRQMQLLRANGDMVGATKIISQLMLVYPDDPRVVGEYGKLLVQEGRSADAVAFLRRAIELQPSDWSLYSAMGVAFDQEGNHADARLVYDHALQLKPGEAAVLNNYGMSRMLAGDPAGARRLFLAAKAAGSSDPRIDANIALLDKSAPLTPVPASNVATLPPRNAAPSVQSAPLPPATTAPRAIVQNGVEAAPVPFDPLAGPVAKKTVKPKPSKLAKAHKAGDKPKAVAATTPSKPAKKSDHIPALRMTADAGKP